MAAVYLRQSSMAQVREHTESTARQYALEDEAVRLGWARGDVRAPHCRSAMSTTTPARR
jgi:DNA invertase Pin-like site-specific DNA recombinase